MIWIGSGAQCIARVRGRDGALITQASITGITFTAYDLDSATPTVAVSGPTALTVSGVVFNAAQTDERWTVDSTGYNFMYEVLESVFTTDGHFYKVVFDFDPASGQDFVIPFKIKANMP